MSDTSDPASAAREENEIPVIPGYQIEAVAGETTSTQSWEALQISLDRRVVLLTLKLSLVGDPAQVAHFEDVARIVARLHHRNVVSIIDIAKTASGLPYVVMEKIEGRRLSEVLRHDGPLPPERAAKIVLQLADALDGAWKQSGFVHRNLKPDNVYVLPDGAAKISSFTYATVVRPGADPLAADGGMLVGTPNYMPPEQIDGLRSIDFHADVYSVGALFYEALTGFAPFHEEDDYLRIFELQKNGTLPAPSDLDPNVPVAFSRIVAKMMAKRPADRYAFWQDAIEDVHRALAGRDLYVPGGGEWVSPRSTVADAAPRPEPEPAAKGKAKGLKIGGAGLKLPGRAAAAPGAPAAAPRIRTNPLAARKAAAAAAAASPAAAPLRAAAPIRAGGAAVAAPAAADAAEAATKPRIAINAALGAVPASDGGTRRAAAVSAAPAADASGAWATPESAYVPPEGAAPAAHRRSKGAAASLLAKFLAFLTVARPPLLVRIAGSAAFVLVLLLAAWLRVGALESVPAASPLDPSSIKAVAPRVGKTVQAPKPVSTAIAAVRPAPKPAAPAPAKPAATPEEAQPAARTAEPEPPAAPPAETASAPQPPPKPAEPETAKRLPLDLYEDALYEIVRDLRRKPWADAKKSAVRALSDVARKVPDKAAACNAIEAAFGMADSWEDLVGMTLYDHPRKRDIVIGRTKHTIVPTGTIPGKLICDRVVNGMTLHNQKLDLSKMDNRQKWAIVRSERPDTTPSALYSRAFLTLAYGGEKEFRAFVEKNPSVSALKEFFLVYELNRGK